MTQAVFVVAEFEVQLDAVEKFIDLANRLLVTPTTQEAGCLRYELCQDLEQVNKLVMLETWESKSALDHHLALPSLKTAVDQLRPYLTSGPTVNIYRSSTP